MRWLLPDRPDHPRYAALFRELKKMPAEESRELTAELCLLDFYLWCKLVASFGRFQIADRKHPRRGKMWVDEPWVFDRLRELQRDSRNGEESAAYFWPRYTFKTENISKNLSLWEATKDPRLTFAFFIHKVQGAGETIFGGIRAELEGNPRYHQLYPAVHPRLSKDYPRMDDEGITFTRKPGPSEPTLSLHPVTRLPTGTHYSHLIEDDLVVRETIKNPNGIKNAIQARKDITGLGSDNSVRRHVGTIWAENDPNMTGIREERFSRVSIERAFLLPEHTVWKKNLDDTNLIPVLRSADLWRKWRREFGEADFAALCMATPVPASEQSFDPAWIRTYSEMRPLRWNPRECVRYMLVDPSGTERRKESGDPWVFRVFDACADGTFRHVDLWRERLNYPAMIDLLFGLVQHWSPREVFIEEFGAQNVVGPVKDAMDLRSFHFKVTVLPKVKIPKEKRILASQVAHAQGLFWYPEKGFGHGSGPRFVDQLLAGLDPDLTRIPRAEVHDKRDTFNQYREDEYLVWSEETPSPTDDMLDSEAWLVLRAMETHLKRPKKPDPVDYKTGLHNLIEKAARRQLDGRHESGRGRPPGLTPWTM